MTYHCGKYIRNILLSVVVAVSKMVGVLKKNSDSYCISLAKKLLTFVFGMGKETLEKEEECNTLGFNAHFYITTGPLLLLEKIYNETFLLEIDFHNFQGEHADALLSSFGAHLSCDYAKITKNGF